MRADEVEEPPRDDEPRKRMEAENSRCRKCRKLYDRVHHCEKCLEERKEIYECWHKETAQLEEKNVIKDRFLKWKGRIAAVGSPALKGVDMPWSTFSPVESLRYGR